MPIFSWLFSDPLAVGAAAPDFTLADEHGRQVKLSEFRGKKNVVLVFYPGDETTVCTKQLCEFRDRWPMVQETDTVVFGVNPAGAASHREFVERQHYQFPLLVDDGRRVATLYNANGLIVKRTVYLIGKDGKIRFAQRGKPLPDVVLKAAQ